MMFTEIRLPMDTNPLYPILNREARIAGRTDNQKNRQL